MSNTVVLFVFEDIPVPNTTGYSTYNHAFLASLANQGFVVHVLVTGNRFSEPFFDFNELINLPGVHGHLPNARRLWGSFHAARPRSLLKIFYRKLFRLGGPFGHWLRSGRANKSSVSIGRWVTENESRSLQSEISKLDPDYVFIDTLFRSPLLDIISPRAKKILIGHDVFFERCESLANNGRRPVPFITAQIEAQVLEKFDAVIAITQGDASAYQQLSPGKKIVAIPSPVVSRQVIKMRKPSGHIFYLGSQAHHNVDGLKWFLETIWPLVLEKRPDVVLDVVGSIADAMNTTAPGVRFHGRIDDFSALTALAMFAINPVRAGSGMKIKMLDYFAHGLGCITTSVGAAGFPEGHDRPIAVCDDPSVFAQSMIAWLENVAICNELKRRSQDYVKLFSVVEFSAGLMQLLDRLSVKDECAESSGIKA